VALNIVKGSIPATLHTGIAEVVESSMGEASRLEAGGRGANRFFQNLFQTVSKRGKEGTIKYELKVLGFSFGEE
jgi:hypothetical protein